MRILLWISILSIGHAAQSYAAAIPGSFELTWKDNQIHGELQVDAQNVRLETSISEDSKLVYVQLESKLTTETHLYVDVIAHEVFGFSPGFRITGKVIKLTPGVGRRREWVWPTHIEKVPGQYLITLQLESGLKQTLPLEVAPDAPPAQVQAPDVKPPGINIALAALGGKVEVASTGPGRGPGSNLIDGFAQIGAESGPALSPGWTNDPKTGFPADVLISFNDNRAATIDRIVINTAGIQFDQLVPPAPKIIEISVADAAEGPFEPVTKSRLWPVYQPQEIAFEPVRARFVRLRIHTGYRSARFAAIGEVSIFENIDATSVVADIEKNIALPSLGGWLELVSSQHNKHQAWRLVDGETLGEHGWIADKSDEYPKLTLSFANGCSAQISRIELHAIQNQPPPQQIAVAIRNARGEKFHDLDAIKLEWHDGIARVALNKSAQAVRVRFSRTSQQDVGLSELRVFEEVGAPTCLSASAAENTAPSIQRESLTNDEFEPNDSLESPTNLTLGQTVSATLPGDADVDWYRFSTDQRLLVTGSLALPDGAVSLERFDAAGTLLDAHEASPGVGSHVYEFSWSAVDESLLKVQSMPIRTVLVWDTSVSMRGRTEPLGDAVRGYLRGLRNNEQVQLISFAQAPQVLLENFSNERGVIGRALENQFNAAGSTALADALTEALKQLDQVNGQRSIVLFSDGQDTSSQNNMIGLGERAAEKGIRVFSIGLGAALYNYSRRMNGTGVQYLQRLAAISNGRYYFTYDATGLKDIYADIAHLVRRGQRYDLTLIGEDARGRVQVSANDVLPNVDSIQLQLILDGSGSMLKRMADGQTRMAVAKEVIGTLVEELPANTEVALRAFGHRISEGAAGDCEDTELLVDFAPVQPQLIKDRIRDLRGLGTTLIAQALRTAAADFDNNEGLIVLVTDGEEECHPNLESALQQLKAEGVAFRLNIVGFEIADTQVRKTLARVAELGGGEYVDSSGSGELRGALRAAVSPRYRVVDGNGTVVGAGLINHTPIELPAGTFKLALEGSTEALAGNEFTVHADQMTQIELRLENSSIKVHVHREDTE